jgi:hypothetical protein
MKYNRKVSPEMQAKMRELNNLCCTDYAYIGRLFNVDRATAKAYIIYDGGTTEMMDNYARKRKFESDKDYREDVERRREIKIEAWKATLNIKEAEN